MEVRALSRVVAVAWQMIGSSMLGFRPLKTGTAPTPETIVSTTCPLSWRALLTEVASLEFPSWMVRFASWASVIPFSLSRLVSLDGVRATGFC
jgi:hypothetical protein